MAKRPLRVTGFTRFFLVMLIIAPLAYIGASYYNGEDGVANIKKLLHLNEGEATVANQEKPDTNKEVVRVNESPNTKELEAENAKLKEELDFKIKRNEELYRENEDLKRKLDEAEKALNALKSK
jgi:hypothetical protein